MIRSAEILPVPSLPPPRLGRRLLHNFESAMHWAGVDSLYAAASGADGAMVALYHSVSDARERRFLDPPSTIDASQFEEQIAFLARERRVASMSDVADALDEGRALPAGSVAITFDDGYRDVLEVAAPILSRHRVAATIYLLTGYVERGENQWIDQVYSAFATRTRNSLQLERPAPRRYVLTRPDQVNQAYAALAATLLPLSWHERKRVLDDLVRQLRPAEEAPRLTLTWADVKDLLVRYPTFEVGVHSRDHIDLSSCSAETVDAEVTACIRDVERELGVRPRHFAYPYGRYDERAASAVERAGLRSAAVTWPAFPIRPGTDRFALPRFVSPASTRLLGFRTSGAYPELPKKLIGRA